MVRKIALEEHFLSPGLVEYWRPTMTEVAPERREYFFRNLTDFGELRLQSMDGAGIARSVLSIAGPGVQAERDARFAHRAMQGAKSAADELERCIRELKFCGAMINGHTQGQYLDDAAL